MIIVAWVLLVSFGLIGVLTFFTYTSSKGITNAQVVLMVFSIIISALSAGVIWGGLLQ